jgi:hypothetical protein
MSAASKVRTHPLLDPGYVRADTQEIDGVRNEVNQLPGCAEDRDAPPDARGWLGRFSASP